MTVRHRAAALFAALLLAGCAATPAPPPAAAALACDPAATLLHEAALRAEAALADLSRATAAVRPVPAPDIPAHAPAELLREITLDWTGPLSTLVAELAGHAGYRFVQAGRPPVRPLLVEVHVEAEPLLLVLRNVGLQAADGAVLEVEPERRIVRLDWAPSASGSASAPAAAPAPVPAPGPAAAPRTPVGRAPAAGETAP